jgi:hypothetical protein
LRWAIDLLGLPSRVFQPSAVANWVRDRGVVVAGDQVAVHLGQKGATTSRLDVIVAGILRRVTGDQHARAPGISHSSGVRALLRIAVLVLALEKGRAGVDHDQREVA